MATTEVDTAETAPLTPLQKMEVEDKELLAAEYDTSADQYSKDELKTIEIEITKALDSVEQSGKGDNETIQVQNDAGDRHLDVGTKEIGVSDSEGGVFEKTPSDHVAEERIYPESHVHTVKEEKDELSENEKQQVELEESSTVENEVDKTEEKAKDVPSPEKIDKGETKVPAGSQLDDQVPGTAGQILNEHEDETQPGANERPYCSEKEVGLPAERIEEDVIAGDAKGELEKTLDAEEAEEISLPENKAEVSKEPEGGHSENRELATATDSPHVEGVKQELPERLTQPEEEHIHIQAETLETEEKVTDAIQDEEYTSKNICLLEEEPENGISLKDDPDVEKLETLSDIIPEKTQEAEPTDSADRIIPAVDEKGTVNEQNTEEAKTEHTPTKETFQDTTQPDLEETDSADVEHHIEKGLCSLIEETQSAESEKIDDDPSGPKTEDENAKPLTESTEEKTEESSDAEVETSYFHAELEKPQETDKTDVVVQGTEESQEGIHVHSIASSNEVDTSPARNFTSEVNEQSYKDKNKDELSPTSCTDQLLQKEENNSDKIDEENDEPISISIDDSITEQTNIVGQERNLSTESHGKDVTGASLDDENEDSNKKEINQQFITEVLKPEEESEKGSSQNDTPNVEVPERPEVVVTDEIEGAVTTDKLEDKIYGNHSEYRTSDTESAREMNFSCTEPNENTGKVEAEIHEHSANVREASSVDQIPTETKDGVSDDAGTSIILEETNNISAASKTEYITPEENNEEKTSELRSDKLVEPEKLCDIDSSQTCKDDDTETNEGEKIEINEKFGTDTSAHTITPDDLSSEVPLPKESDQAETSQNEEDEKPVPLSETPETVELVRLATPSGNADELSASSSALEPVEKVEHILETDNISMILEEENDNISASRKIEDITLEENIEETSDLISDKLVEPDKLHDIDSSQICKDEDTETKEVEKTEIYEKDVADTSSHTITPDDLPSEVPMSVESDQAETSQIEEDEKPVQISEIPETVELVRVVTPSGNDDELSASLSVLEPAEKVEHISEKDNTSIILEEENDNISAANKNEDITPEENIEETSDLRLETRVEPEKLHDIESSQTCKDDDTETKDEEKVEICEKDVTDTSSHTPITSDGLSSELPLPAESDQTETSQKGEDEKRVQISETPKTVELVRVGIPSGNDNELSASLSEQKPMEKVEHISETGKEDGTSECNIQGIAEELPEVSLGDTIVDVSHVAELIPENSEGKRSNIADESAAENAIKLEEVSETSILTRGLVEVSTKAEQIEEEASMNHIASKIGTPVGVVSENLDDSENLEKVTELGIVDSEKLIQIYEPDLDVSENLEKVYEPVLDENLKPLPSEPDNSEKQKQKQASEPDLDDSEKLKQVSEPDLDYSGIQEQESVPDRDNFENLQVSEPSPNDREPLRFSDSDLIKSENLKNVSEPDPDDSEKNEDFGKTYTCEDCNEVIIKEHPGNTDVEVVDKPADKQTRDTTVSDEASSASVGDESVTRNIEVKTEREPSIYGSVHEEDISYRTSDLRSEEATQESIAESNTLHVEQTVGIILPDNDEEDDETTEASEKRTTKEEGVEELSPPADAFVEIRTPDKEGKDISKEEEIEDVSVDTNKEAPEIPVTVVEGDQTLNQEVNEKYGEDGKEAVMHKTEPQAMEPEHLPELSASISNDDGVPITHLLSKDVPEEIMQEEKDQNVQDEAGKVTENISVSEIIMKPRDNPGEETEQLPSKIEETEVASSILHDKKITSLKGQDDKQDFPEGAELEDFIKNSKEKDVPEDEQAHSDQLLNELEENEPSALGLNDADATILDPEVVEEELSTENKVKGDDNLQKATKAEPDNTETLKFSEPDPEYSENQTNVSKPDPNSSDNQEKVDFLEDIHEHPVPTIVEIQEKIHEHPRETIVLDEVCTISVADETVPCSFELITTTDKAPKENIEDSVPEDDSSHQILELHTEETSVPTKTTQESTEESETGYIEDSGSEETFSTIQHNYAKEENQTSKSLEDDNINKVESTEGLSHPEHAFVKGTKPDEEDKINKKEEEIAKSVVDIKEDEPEIHVTLVDGDKTLIQDEKEQYGKAEFPVDKANKDAFLYESEPEEEPQCLPKEPEESEPFPYSFKDDGITNLESKEAPDDVLLKDKDGLGNVAKVVENISVSEEEVQPHGNPGEEIEHLPIDTEETELPKSFSLKSDEDKEETQDDIKAEVVIEDRKENDKPEVDDTVEEENIIDEVAEQEAAEAQPDKLVNEPEGTAQSLSNATDDDKIIHEQKKGPKEVTENKIVEAIVQQDETREEILHIPNVTEDTEILSDNVTEPNADNRTDEEKENDQEKENDPVHELETGTEVIAQENQQGEQLKHLQSDDNAAEPSTTNVDDDDDIENLKRGVDHEAAQIHYETDDDVKEIEHINKEVVQETKSLKLEYLPSDSGEAEPGGEYGKTPDFKTEEEPEEMKHNEKETDHLNVVTEENKNAKVATKQEDEQGQLVHVPDATENIEPSATYTSKMKQTWLESEIVHDEDLKDKSKKDLTEVNFEEKETVSREFALNEPSTENADREQVEGKEHVKDQVTNEKVNATELSTEEGKTGDGIEHFTNLIEDTKLNASSAGDDKITSIESGENIDVEESKKSRQETGNEIKENAPSYEDSRTSFEELNSGTIGSMVNLESKEPESVEDIANEDLTIEDSSLLNNLENKLHMSNLESEHIDSVNEEAAIVDEYKIIKEPHQSTVGNNIDEIVSEALPAEEKSNNEYSEGITETESHGDQTLKKSPSIEVSDSEVQKDLIKSANEKEEEKSENIIPVAGEEDKHDLLITETHIEKMQGSEEDEVPILGEEYRVANEFVTPIPDERSIETFEVSKPAVDNQVDVMAKEILNDVLLGQQEARTLGAGEQNKPCSEVLDDATTEEIFEKETCAKADTSAGSNAEPNKSDEVQSEHEGDGNVPSIKEKLSSEFEDANMATYEVSVKVPHESARECEDTVENITKEEIDIKGSTIDEGKNLEPVMLRNLKPEKLNVLELDEIKEVTEHVKLQELEAIIVPVGDERTEEVSSIELDIERTKGETEGEIESSIKPPYISKEVGSANEAQFQEQITVSPSDDKLETDQIIKNEVSHEVAGKTEVSTVSPQVSTTEVFAEEGKQINEPQAGELLETKIVTVKETEAVRLDKEIQAEEIQELNKGEIRGFNSEMFTLDESDTHDGAIRVNLANNDSTEATETTREQVVLSSITLEKLSTDIQNTHTTEEATEEKKPVERENPDGDVEGTTCKDPITIAYKTDYNKPSSETEIQSTTRELGIPGNKISTVQIEESDTKLAVQQPTQNTTDAALGESPHGDKNLRNDPSPVSTVKNGVQQEILESTTRSYPEVVIPESAKETKSDIPLNIPAENSLSDLLQVSTKDTIQMAQQTNPTSKKEDLQKEEPKDDEDEEWEEHKKTDSSSDGVIVEASRDMDVKTPQKKHHGILSGVGIKVKNSISKVKKAITGKSSHTKPPSPK